jgi:hypothetical protein
MLRRSLMALEPSGVLMINCLAAADKVRGVRRTFAHLVDTVAGTPSPQDARGTVRGNQPEAEPPQVARDLHDRALVVSLTLNSAVPEAARHRRDFRLGNACPTCAACPLTSRSNAFRDPRLIRPEELAERQHRFLDEKTVYPRFLSDPQLRQRPPKHHLRGDARHG